MAVCHYCASFVCKDGFAVHKQNTTIPAVGPGKTGVRRWQRTKPFVLFPWVGELPLRLRGFLTLVLERAYLAGDVYAPETDVELGKLAGLSRATVSELLTELRQRGLIHSTIVNGRRRIYPVDKDGNRTMPLELPVGARPPREARAPLHEGAHAAPPTIGDPARVVVVQELESNDPPKPPERQRPAHPAPTLAPVQPMAIAERPSRSVHCVAIEAKGQGLPAIAGTAAIEPTALVVAPAQPIEITPQVTPRLESWAALVTRRAEAPKSPEEQLRGALSAAACAALDALPGAQREKMIREFACGAMTQASISYVQKKLTMPVAAGQVAVPEVMGTEELIRRLPGCTDGSLPKIVAQRLANEFGGALDQRLWTAFDSLMTAAWCGTVDADALAFAYEKAIKKEVCEKRGAYFWAVVKDRTGIRGEDLKRLASGGRS